MSLYARRHGSNHDSVMFRTREEVRALFQMQLSSRSLEPAQIMNFSSFLLARLCFPYKQAFPTPRCLCVLPQEVVITLPWAHASPLQVLPSGSCNDSCLPLAFLPS